MRWKDHIYKIRKAVRVDLVDIHRLFTFKLEGEASKWWLSLYHAEDRDVVT